MQVRAETTRRGIIQAAAEIFERQGYSGTSLREVTNNQGVTKGALYFHFASKDDLAIAVINEHYQMWPQLLAELRTRWSSPTELVVALSLEVAMRFRDDPLVRAGIRLVFERDLIKRPAPMPFIGWVTLVNALLLEVRAEGNLLPSVDPQQAAELLVAAFTGVQQMSQALAERTDIVPRMVTLWRCLAVAFFTEKGARLVDRVLMDCDCRNPRR